MKRGRRRIIRLSTLYSWLMALQPEWIDWTHYRDEWREQKARRRD